MKNKNMLVGVFFVIFLMISTAVIARPIQEKTNIEQQTISSFEELHSEITKNPKLYNLLKSLAKDVEIKSLINMIAQAKNNEEMINNIIELTSVIQEKIEFKQITQILGVTDGCSLCAEKIIVSGDSSDSLDSESAYNEIQPAGWNPIECLILWLLAEFYIWIVPNILMLFAVAELAKSKHCLWAMSSSVVSGNVQNVYESYYG